MRLGAGTAPGQPDDALPPLLLVLMTPSCNSPTGSFPASYPEPGDRVPPEGAALATERPRGLGRARPMLSGDGQPRELAGGLPTSGGARQRSRRWRRRRQQMKQASDRLLRESQKKSPVCGGRTNFSVAAQIILAVQRKSQLPTVFFPAETAGVLVSFVVG